MIQFRVFDTQAAERCFVGVEVGTDPGPAPMMTCERHKLDGRLDGRLLGSQKSDRCLWGLSGQALGTSTSVPKKVQVIEPSWMPLALALSAQS